MLEKNERGMLGRYIDEQLGARNADDAPTAGAPVTEDVVAPDSRDTYTVISLGADPNPEVVWSGSVTNG